MTGRWATWVPLLVAVAGMALAGCLSPGGGDTRPLAGWAATWEPDACDPSGAGGISGDAPVLAAYRGSPEEVARRFAEALGEDLPPDRGTDDDGRRHVWSNGTVSVRHEAGPSGLVDQLRYTTDEVWPAHDTGEGRRVIGDVLDRFGVPGHVDVRVDRPTSRFEVLQLRDGVPLGGPGGVPAADALPGDGSGDPGHGSSFRLRLLHDLRDAEATHPVDEARRTAEAYMRCVMDRQGRTAEDGWTLEDVRDLEAAVRHESLAHVFQLSYDDPDPDAHCDHVVKLVYVDAETGAVLDDGVIGCD